MNREDLERTLDAVDTLVAPRDLKEQEALEGLLTHPGLPILWGLMLGARQAQYRTLSNAPMTNMETVSRAAVIQGTILGIELLYATLLQFTVSSGSAESKEQR